MKSDRKHDLQTNDLAESISNFILRIKPYSRYILALAVLVAAIMLWQYMTYQTRVQAGELALMRFYHATSAEGAAALEDFVEDFPDSPQRPLAMLLLANRLFHAAVIGPGEDAKRPPAEEQLAKAEKLYREIAGRYPDHAPLANYGLAMVSAQRGKMEEAKEQLSALTKAHRGEIVGDMAMEEKIRLAGLQPVEFATEKKPEQKEIPDKEKTTEPETKKEDKEKPNP
ncbi:MAG: hypothetical protein QGD94_02995 [Planctomycetia bacterium]|nr:hypothetical protein [Planctomycetia bacterium]